MKRILMSLLMIGVVGATLMGATKAWFMDAEAADATYTAGTLDLTVNGSNGSTVHVVRENMKPKTEWTYQDYNQQFVLKNVGTLPGTVSWKIKNIKNIENGCIEPETAMGDITCDVNQGELGQYTWVQWSRNQAPWGNFGSQFKPFNSAEGVVVSGQVLQPGESLNAYMWFDFPGRADNMENQAQGDGLTFDVEFTLTQIQP